MEPPVTVVSIDDHSPEAYIENNPNTRIMSGFFSARNYAFDLYERIANHLRDDCKFFATIDNGIERDEFYFHFLSDGPFAWSFDHSPSNDPNEIFKWASEKCVQIR